MINLTLDDRFSVPATVTAKQLKDEAVLLDLREGLYFGLNDVGSRIWAMISEERSLGEICDHLINEYAVSRDELERHVLGLAAQLLGKGLIEPAV